MTTVQKTFSGEYDKPQKYPNALNIAEHIGDRGSLTKVEFDVLGEYNITYLHITKEDNSKVIYSTTSKVIFDQAKRTEQVDTPSLPVFTTLSKVKNYLCLK